MSRNKTSLDARAALDAMDKAAKSIESVGIAVPSPGKPRFDPAFTRKQRRRSTAVPKEPTEDQQRAMDGRHTDNRSSTS
jgi:hypothetical protein